MLRGAITALVVLAFAAPAHATTLVDSGGRTPQPYQQWVHEMKVPTVPGEIRLFAHACPNPDAIECTGEGEPILIAPGWGLSSLELRQVLYHALGHHFSYAMREPTRRRFQAIMRDRRPWTTENEDPPREQFAEGYSLCALGGSLARRYLRGGGGRYGYSPTRAQNRAVCALIRSL